MRTTTSMLALLVSIATLATTGCPARPPPSIGVFRTALHRPEPASRSPAIVVHAVAPGGPQAVPPEVQPRQPGSTRAWTVDLRPFLLPPADQGIRNTCNSFAATGLMEFLVAKATGTVQDFSENWNYYLARTAALDTPYLRNMYGGEDGLAGFLAAQAYEESGPLPEAVWPYVRENACQQGNPDCAADADGRVPEPCLTGVPPDGAAPLGYRLRVEFVPREEIASFLLNEQRPVMMNVYWYVGIDDESGRITRLPTDEEVDACFERGEGCMGHTILLVGYDESAREFLFRNSGGATWGDGGYGIMPERYVVESCEACPFLANIDAYGPEDREFLQRASQGVSGVLADDT